MPTPTSNLDFGQTFVGNCVAFLGLSKLSKFFYKETCLSIFRPNHLRLKATEPLVDAFTTFYFPLGKEKWRQNVKVSVATAATANAAENF